MAERDDEEKKNVVDTTPKESEEAENLPVEAPRDVDMCVENQMPSQQKEEEIIKKKYGGLPAKKPPLISKDHERAFFDSADWALGKRSKGPIEALRPKLQPSPHHQARSRSPCAPADDAEGDSIDQQDDADVNSGISLEAAENVQG
ncbi:hypothetical protein SASPL_130877 [Salvia splendens]|uniref:Negatively light-regulated protein n=1 Tax=Salvia splendens TaxID=180675 RepID=A0A8X8ZK33_SALSN|nr:uncharacterized protein LOC121755482 [Salvia splendens]XP_042006713.1 uncharacterized protein LOC121755482 [Salvia splendens]KAG6407877.1 hypothetical protein SASPL_130877 [Salvia splendens]